jgi:hypothetical protein
VLAALASPMSGAVLGATIFNLLDAALQLTLPPAHGPPPRSLHGGCRPNPTAAAGTLPLSPQRSDSAHWTPHTRRWQCESRSDVAACLGQDGQSAWAGDVRWVCSRGGWTETHPRPPPPGSQAACASCLSQTLMAGSNAPSTPATRRPQHDGGIPWSVPAVLRVGLLC